MKYNFTENIINYYISCFVSPSDCIVYFNNLSEKEHSIINNYIEEYKIYKSINAFNRIYYNYLNIYENTTKVYEKIFLIDKNIKVEIDVFISKYYEMSRLSKINKIMDENDNRS